MDRLTSKRCSGIKSGYWSPARKEDLCQRLGPFEDIGLEPEEIKSVFHAHWVYNPNGNDWGIGAWCCSKCHYKNDAIGILKKPSFPISMIAGTKFCANCGAVMDQEEFHE